MLYILKYRQRKFKIVHNNRTFDMVASEYELDKNGLHIIVVVDDKKYKIATFKNFEYIYESSVF